MGLICSEVLAGLAGNPALPPALLARFIAEADAELSEELVRRADLTAEQRHVLAGRTHVEDPAAMLVDPDPQVRSRLACWDDIGSDAVESLARDADIDVVTSAAACQPLPAALLDELMRDARSRVRAALARNQHLPGVALAVLARTDDHEMHIALTDNPATPVDVLVPWTEHPAALVRWGLARRRDLPVETYERLAEDPLPGVRWDVAANPALAETERGRALVARLALSTEQSLLQSLVHNPGLELEALERLAPNVRIGPVLLPRVARATEDELRRLATSSAPQVRALAAQRPDLPEDLVRVLVADSAPKVVRAVVTAPSLTAEQLRQVIARHGTPKTLRRLAGHPNLAAESIVDLLCSSDGRTARAAAANPSLPVAEMERLLS